ncbi:5'-methylthioadenosine/adenosylhomocysteine nucleosidase [Liquorilactobacillus ghanensis]|uniref:5'-methylthioadenosine/adenosylhomocysteine nucleosidase n=1 Tax=Liquorilactobacillus ghanensis TaxID=399370 RepID=UPI0039ECD9C6
MKYGILCAMEEEIKDLRANLTDYHETVIGGISFYEGNYQQQKVVLTRSGIGKVQAGMTTALLFAEFQVDAVINSGSAGGIGAGLQVGDVVIASEVAYHDVDATAFGYQIGQLPQQPVSFAADQVLAQKLAAAAKQTTLTVKEGLIVSGDQFVAGNDAIAVIKKNFPTALSCEMEGAAVGQTAYQFKKPFAVVRAMSDTADGHASQSFDEFVIEAGHRSATMILNFLAHEV